MARFYGVVGYAVNVKKAPGVWDEQITERGYYGDVFRNARRLEPGDTVIDDLRVNNSISIMADTYANAHFFAIRYVKWMGTRWKVTNVEVQRPRLILTFGGVYNGT